MEILDLSKNNCWFIWLIPFSVEIRSYPDIIIPYQNNCIKKGIFGLGWRSKHNENSIKDEYRRIKQRNLKKEESYKNALGCYKAIKEGDYVITRTREGNVYIGRVSQPAMHFEKNEDVLDQICLNESAEKYRYFDTPFEYTEKTDSGKDEKKLYTRRQFLGFPEISYGCYVEEWYKCSIDIIPSEIQGRLSQRRHPTIQAVNVIRQQVLFRAMYDVVTSETESTDIPKIERNRKNFVRSFNYMELEDLVAYYILHNNPDFMLQPSSCKINEPKYEYRFVCSGKAPITCQVKSQANIELSDYYDDASIYSKIYLFCGLWEKESTIKQLSDIISSNGYTNIIIISPDDLYTFLLNSTEFFSDRYYRYSDQDSSIDMLSLTTKLTDAGYSERKKKQRHTEFNFTISYAMPSEPQKNNIEHDYSETDIDYSSNEDTVLQDGDISFFKKGVIISPEIGKILVVNEDYQDKAYKIKEAIE